VREFVLLVEQVLDSSDQRQRAAQLPARGQVGEHVAVERHRLRPAEVLALAGRQHVEAELDGPEGALDGDRQAVAGAAQQLVARLQVARILVDGLDAQSPGAASYS